MRVDNNDYALFTQHELAVVVDTAREEGVQLVSIEVAQGGVFGVQRYVIDEPSLF